jgi:hypothetical protein
MFMHHLLGERNLFHVDGLTHWGTPHLLDGFFCQSANNSWKILVHGAFEVYPTLLEGAFLPIDLQVELRQKGVSNDDTVSF